MCVTLWACDARSRAISARSPSRSNGRRFPCRGSPGTSDPFVSRGRPFVWRSPFREPSTDSSAGTIFCLTVVGIGAAGAMAAFAAYIFKFRVGRRILETRLVAEPHGVADDAFGVILPEGRPLSVFERFVGMGVGALLPNFERMLMTIGAAFIADVFRLLAAWRRGLKLVRPLRIYCEIIACFSVPRYISPSSL